MTAWPRHLVPRVLLAGGAAAMAVWGLQALVQAEDRRVHASMTPSPTSLSPSPLASLGLRLRPVAGTVHVAMRLEAIAPDVAPVVQVLADGSLALRRPPPLAQQPLASPGGAGGAVAVLVTAPTLAALDAAQRSTLLDLLATWIDERPVPPARLRLVDVTWTAADLGRLLAWAP